MKYFIDISYLGASYNGWQRQENTLNTIQYILEQALTKVSRHDIVVCGSGRTDKGVNAIQQVGHLSLPEKLDPREIIYRANKILPKDIVINKIRKVSDDSHARFDAISRTYKYIIITKRNPFYNDRALLYTKRLDLKKLKEVAEILLHYNNFKSFCKQPEAYQKYNCDIQYAEWHKKENKIEFTISANRFLRGMVRAIVGTSLKVGAGIISPQDFENIIKVQDRSCAYDNVLPMGLFLMKVIYEKSIFVCNYSTYAN